MPEWPISSTCPMWSTFHRPGRRVRHTALLRSATSPADAPGLEVSWTGYRAKRASRAAPRTMSPDDHERPKRYRTHRTNMVGHPWMENGPLEPPGRVDPMPEAMCSAMAIATSSSLSGGPKFNSMRRSVLLLPWWEPWYA